MRAAKALAVVLGAAMAAGALAGDGWVTLKPQGRGFTVRMPGVPAFDSGKVHEQGLTYPTYRYRVVKGNLTYQVGGADLGIALPFGEGDEFLQNVIGGMAKSGQLAVLQNEKVDVQGRPARIFMFRDKGQGLMSGMTCWDGKRSFLVTLKGPISEMSGTKVRDFFKTFKLLP